MLGDGARDLAGVTAGTRATAAARDRLLIRTDVLRATCWDTFGHGCARGGSLAAVDGSQLPAGSSALAALVRLADLAGFGAVEIRHRGLRSFRHQYPPRFVGLRGF